VLDLGLVEPAGVDRGVDEDQVPPARLQSLDRRRYASSRLADGVTYVALLEIDDGVENPLPALSEFQELQENLKGWVAEPPTLEQLTVVGSYRFFD